MSYHPYNSISVTPISLLKNAPNYPDQDDGYHSEGFDVPKVYQNRRIQAADVSVPPLAPAPAGPTASPDPMSGLSCELRHIKYLLMALVLLFLLFLIFKK